MKTFRVLSSILLSIVYFTTTTHAGAKVCTKEEGGFSYVFTGTEAFQKIGGSVIVTYQCVRSKGELDGEIQCRQQQTEGADSFHIIQHRPDLGLVLLAWGNISADNHVVTAERVTCESY